MRGEVDQVFLMSQETPALRMVSLAKKPKPSEAGFKKSADQMPLELHMDHGVVCGVCGLRSTSLEAYQEHLTEDVSCASEFSTRGCPTCLLFFTTSSACEEHTRLCPSAVAAGFLKSNRASDGMKASSGYWSVGGVGSPSSVLESQFLDREGPLRSPCSRGSAAVALVCETVGGGVDGSVDIAARICIIDEHESVLIDTLVQPSLPVTTFRCTGMSAQDLDKGVPFKVVRRQVMSILFTGSTSPFADLNAEPLSQAQRRPLLLGHNLHHHLECLMIDYPEELMRDTATYPPLLKPCGSPNTLSTLAQNRLCLDLRTCDARDLKKEALATLRLYHLFRTAPPAHNRTSLGSQSQEPEATTAFFPSFKKSLSGKMRSNQLPNETAKEVVKYKCWCMDGRR